MNDGLDQALNTLRILKDNAVRQNARWYAERALVAMQQIQAYQKHQGTAVGRDRPTSKAYAKKQKAVT